MRLPEIVCLKTKERINPSEIFGKDADRLLKACAKIFENSLYPYEGCYKSLFRPTLREVRALAITEGKNLALVYRDMVKAWEEENPEEIAKERLSREEWENNYQKQFRIIFGIAKKHRLHLEWHGEDSPSFGDRWTIWQKKERFARIYCM